MNNNKIVIDVEIIPKQKVEYITVNFTMDTWKINKKRSEKIKKIIKCLTL
jgi:hypothetical protein